jgi:asparagine synthase (glutamine-hydrolysing)
VAVHGAAALLTGDVTRRDLAIDVLDGEASIARRLLSANPRAERLVVGADRTAAAREHAAAWQATAGLGSRTVRAMALDTTRYLVDDILHKVDRAAMSIALETRLPLLDHRVVALAWRLPAQLRLQDGGKWVLRELLARDVPRALFERPKRGFSVPIGSWLRGSLRPWAAELLSEPALADHGLLDVAQVRRLWIDHVAGRRELGSALWPVLMFQAWHAQRRPR